MNTCGDWQRNTQIQSVLNKVLKNKKFIKTLIWIKVVRNFEIINNRYKRKVPTITLQKEKITNVEENAVNTKLTAEVPVKADLSANTTVTLAEDAKNSELTLSKKVDVEVKAAEADKAVEDVTVKIAKDAEGASLKTEVKVEVEAEANATVTVDKAAEGTTVVVTDENVKVDVEKTDEDGNVSKEEVTSTPAPAPDTTPSTPSTPSNPSTPSTPTPEQPPVPTVTATVSGNAITVTKGTEANTYSVTAKAGEVVVLTVSATGYEIKTENVTVGTTAQDKTITLTATGKTDIKVTITVTPSQGGTDEPTNPDKPNPDQPTNPDPDKPTEPDQPTDKTETITVTFGGSVKVVSGDAITVSGSSVTVTGADNSPLTLTQTGDKTLTATFTVSVPQDTKTLTVNFSGTITNGSYSLKRGNASVTGNKDTVTITNETKLTYTITITKSN